jgi:phosphoribosylformylglycinamidine (FGAM) synthase-like enzyme
LRAGAPPVADLAVARKLHAHVANLVTERVPNGIHDCSEGGLAVALAEMAISGAVGFEVTIGDAVACFSESASRVVLSVDAARADAIVADAVAAGVPAAVIGRAHGTTLHAEGAFDVSFAEAASTYRDAIPTLMGAVRVSG